MKIIIDNYTFDKTEKTLTFNDYESVSLSRLLLIVNVTTNTIIYNFADPTLGGIITDNVLALDYDTSSMSDADYLMVQYDDPDESPASELVQVDSQVALDDIRSAVQGLATARGGASDLRVTLVGGTASIGTVTTVTTVATVTTMANQTSMGGFLAAPQIPSLTNQTAVMSNINNVIIT